MRVSEMELDEFGRKLREFVQNRPREFARILNTSEVQELLMQEVEKRTGRRDFLKAGVLGLLAVGIGGSMPASADVDIWPDKIEIDGSQLAKANDVIVTATKVVAASDSKDKRSHYACDGTDDQVEINQAIQDLAT